VLVGGLPGTGKSVLAGAIADRLGSVVLSSDRIRKELAGFAPEQSAAAPFQSGIYERGWTERTYSEVLSRASRLLALGESVVLDASWTSAEQRSAAAAVADKCCADLVQLRCAVPAKLAAQRLRARTAGVSDATWGVAEQMSVIQSPWPGSTTIDTSDASLDGPSAHSLGLALATIKPHGPEHAWRAARPYMLPG
jgi:predicted kinase